jgi:hypothetical protein
MLYYMYARRRKEMTTSLLATLIFCGLIILPMGALIYLSNRIKTRNPYYRPFPRVRGDVRWPLVFLRPGMGNPGADLREGERFAALMEAGRQKRLRQCQRHTGEKRFYN